MRDSSYGGPRRAPGDCTNAPNVAVYYPGTTTDVPLLQAGNINFVGGISWDSGRGIGHNGPSAPGVFSIPFDKILKGGSGVKLRTCIASTKKKVRMKCCEPTCGEGGERTSVEIQQFSTCEFPVLTEDLWLQPYDVYFSCGCAQTCCQRLTKLAGLINADPKAPVVASVANVGEEWFFYLEAKVAGVNFKVQSWEGLTEPDEIVPNYTQEFTAAKTKGFFPTEVLGACDADKCLSACEFWFYDDIPDDSHGSIGMTSNYLSAPSSFTTILRHAIVFFDPNVVNSAAALTALNVITAGTSEYNKIRTSSASADFVLYKFCISRVDDGGGTALTTTRANYTTQVISLNRTKYDGTKSFYTLSTTSATPPTPNGSDVVVAGSCGADDYPCTVADGCPEPEEGVCIGC